MKNLLLMFGFLLICGSAHGQGTGTTIRHGSTLPATCVANTGQQFSLNNTALVPGMYECKTTNTWTAIKTVIATGPRAINAIDYGVKADTIMCLGINATIVVTNGSHTVSCSTASFTSADIGKTIFATTGCCLANQSVLGTTILAPTTISSITTSTTVVVVGTATATCNGLTTCELVYGTNDDTAWTAADAAWSAEGNVCRVMIMPAGFSMIKLVHFNTTPSTCVNGIGITAQLDLSQAFVGQGPGNSVFVIQPDINLNTCVFGLNIAGMNGCYFNQAQLYLANFSFTGAGTQATTSPTNPTCIVSIWGGSQGQQMSFNGFAANTANTTGVCWHSGMRFVMQDVDGFGKNTWATDDLQGFGAESICFYCYAGDSTLGISFAARMVDIGSEYGAVKGASQAGITISGDYHGYGVHTFQNGTNSGDGTSQFQVSGTARFTDMEIDNENCGAGGGTGACNGVLLTGGGIVYATNTLFKGTATGAGINAFGCTTCKYYDLGGNNVVTTANYTAPTHPVGLPSAAGTPTIASGFGTSASIASGSSTSAFTINVGTSNTGTGVLTMPNARPGTGWSCTATDGTTTSTTVSITKVAPTSATSVTFQNYSDTFGTHAWVDNDILNVQCNAY